MVSLSKTINVLQAAKGSSEMWRINKTEANCCPRSREARGTEAILGTRPHSIKAGLAQETRNRYLMVAGSGRGQHSPSEPRARVGLHCWDAWHLGAGGGGGPGIAGRFLNMKGTACGRWGGGARRSREKGLWGSPGHKASFLIQHSLEGLPTPPRGGLGPVNSMDPEF